MTCRVVPERLRSFERLRSAGGVGGVGCGLRVSSGGCHRDGGVEVESAVGFELGGEVAAEGGDAGGEVADSAAAVGVVFCGGLGYAVVEDVDIDPVVFFADGDVAVFGFAV